MKKSHIRRWLAAHPIEMRRHLLIVSGFTLLAAALLFAGFHRSFVRHIYTDPHEFADKLNEEILDLDHDDAKKRTPSDDPRLVDLPNFGYVTDTLSRGAQPGPEGFDSLRRFGVQTVVDFRSEQGQIDAERQRVEALGMRFVSIPWKAEDIPDDRQVITFLDLIRDNPNKKLFVHCEAGHDRTGVMIAVFRMAIQHWTRKQALAEMRVFGFRSGWYHFWMSHLEEYVERFPEQLVTDPDLRSLQAVVASSPTGTPKPARPPHASLQRANSPGKAITQENTERELSLSR
jgi:tyrosine-protein phosphatase SIW14